MSITGEYTVLNAGEELFLICRGSENVTWDSDTENMEQKLTQSFYKDDKNYFAKLIIPKASYLDTGDYICQYDHETSDENENEEGSRSVYVFVKDKNHIFLPMTDDKDIFVNQYENRTISCRTTSPDIKVELKRNGLQVSNVVSYDHKTGAVAYFNKTSDGGQYFCIGSNKFTTEELKINIHVLKRRFTIVERPNLKDDSVAHFVGLHLNLSCTVKLTFPQMVMWSWDFPLNVKQNDSRLQLINVAKGQAGSTTRLILSNLSKEDSGNYTCFVTDDHKNVKKRTITVNVKDQPYINLSSLSSSKPTPQKVGLDVKFIVRVDAYPAVKKYEWFFNNNEIITDVHYDIKNTYKNSTLIISRVNISDDGVYMLRAINDAGFQTINMTLIVRDKPKVSISGPSYILLDTNQPFQCTVMGNPIPEIYWSFKKCLQKEKCSAEPIINKTDKTENLYTIKSELIFNANISGTLICVANNTEGSNLSEKEIIITDIPDGDDGFNAWKVIETVSVGDSLVLYCGASKYNFSGSIEWYLNKSDNPLESNNDDGYKIFNSSTPYSYRKNIEIFNITKDYNGNYRCGNGLHSNSIELKVVDPESPNITDTNLNDTEIKLIAGKHHVFYCHASGIPIPTIIWKKDDQLWIPDTKRIKVSKDNETVTFNYTLKEDNGRYSCEVSNRLDTIINRSKLTISDGIVTKKISRWILIVPSLCIIVLLISIILLYIKLRDEKRRIAEFENAGLNHFDEGDVECINPDLAIDDQADLLPYYNDWEFPKDKLKLGKVLGSGAFGVVVKAEAQGIVDGQESTTVAVKMVKKTADIIYVKALVSELKIMVHLGRHVNVANLLGACTKNLVSKRELLVIVEYCRYGNLLYYLHRHRRDFVNQIDPLTGDFNTSIGGDDFRRRGSSNVNSPLHSPISFFNRTVAGLDYRAEPEVSTSQESNTRPTSFDKQSDTVSSNNSSEQPEWRSNYQADYYDHKAPICSKDLLCWAFQIARGMEYLVSRRVLHGDLAARNVLVAENNVVKICDFGLAKSIYKDSNYVRKKDCPLPVRWMALESIRDQIFSVQSDVWSYGVVLWELFSLGQSPYSELVNYNKFLQRLEDGYRLQKPKFATQKLYQIMLQCWEIRPKNRPLFDKLVNDIGMMLENADREHYVNLNDPYLIMNAIKGKEHSDYLAMMSTPDFENFSSSQHYVNTAPIASHSAECDKKNPSGSNTEYLCMRPISVSKNLDDPINTEKSATNATSSEITPMLTLNNTSDTNYDIESDSGLTTPDYKNISMKKNDFVNPTYLISTGTYSNIDFE
ncbi:vascular endothelial growth factor receptor kdr-like [Chrysoperla carnea]|uniref:vascular endothelial growth factor receptor kdr-like n=1 Tax=Chrysoperla carnea TaxID=189513 RepID=UPI001D09560F|nr:vascular endothelial growth factor receptor kdr-like [Chrysoperla carnea]